MTSTFNLVDGSLRVEDVRVDLTPLTLSTPHGLPYFRASHGSNRAHCAPAMLPADILDIILGNNLIRSGDERRTAQELMILRCVAKRFLFAVNEHVVNLVDRGFSVSRREDDAVDALDAAQKILLAKLIAADWLLLIVGCARRDGNVRGKMHLKMLVFKSLRTILRYTHCDHGALHFSIASDTFRTWRQELLQGETWREAEFRSWSRRICQALQAPELPDTAIHKALTVGFMPSAAEKSLSKA